MVEVKNVEMLAPARVTWVEDGITTTRILYLDYVGQQIYEPSGHPMPHSAIFAHIRKGLQPSRVPPIPKTDNFEPGNYPTP